MKNRSRRSRSGLSGLVLVVFGLTSNSKAAQPPSDINAEVVKLSSGSPSEQQAAMKALEKAGPRSIKPLLAVVRADADGMAKQRAARTLKRILKQNLIDEQAIDEIDSLTKSADYHVADSAISLAAEIRTERGRGLIRKAIRDHANEHVRGKAIGALLVSSAHAATEESSILAALKDPSDFVQLRAASALGQIGNSAGAAKCIEVLSRPPERKNLSLLLEAAVAAGDIGDSSALPALEKLAASRKYGPARIRALEAIQAIKLKHLDTSEKQLALLKADLRDASLASWAAYRLLDRGGSEALLILNETAQDKTHPAQVDAIKALNAKTENDN